MNIDELSDINNFKKDNIPEKTIGNKTDMNTMSNQILDNNIEKKKSSKQSKNEEKIQIIELSDKDEEKIKEKDKEKLKDANQVEKLDSYENDKNYSCKK